VPRKPRIEAAGGIHHVWQRGNNRRPIFLADADRRLFLHLLERAASKHGWIPLAYCLMNNHFHLVLETPSCTLGDGMRDFGSRYAQLFNERHETGGGHMYQARFGSRLVTTDAQFAQLLRYVAYNPVKAGLCPSPDAWPWSSHVALASMRAHALVRAERVASLLAPFGGDPARRYGSLFERGGPMQRVPLDLSPWELRPRLGLILSHESLGVAIRTAREHGYRLEEIAQHLGMHRTTLWRRMQRTGSVPD
jgi:REP element-mobilizing transposase RayT/AraC-like DNA-binding protein